MAGDIGRVARHIEKIWQAPFESGPTEAKESFLEPKNLSEKTQAAIKDFEETRAICERRLAGTMERRSTGEAREAGKSHSHPARQGDLARQGEPSSENSLLRESRRLLETAMDAERLLKPRTDGPDPRIPREILARALVADVGLLVRKTRFLAATALAFAKEALDDAGEKAASGDFSEASGLPGLGADSGAPDSGEDDFFDPYGDDPWERFLDDLAGRNDAPPFGRREAKKGRFRKESAGKERCRKQKARA